MFWVLVTWVIVNKFCLLCVTWFNLKDTFLSATPFLIDLFVVIIDLNNSYLTTFSYQSIKALEDLLSFSQDDIFSWITGKNGQVQNVFGNVFLKNFGLRKNTFLYQSHGIFLPLFCSLLSAI